MKRILFTAFLSVLLCALSGIAYAQYPDKAVTYVIPFGPGGESDVAARLQQETFRKLFGQEMIVQYKPGAGGAVGWASLNGMPGDGYTIMGTNLPHIVLQPLQKGSSYQTDDVTNVYMFHYTPDALLVSAKSPYKTLAEYVEGAKKAPGTFTVSGTGTYSANDAAQSTFDKMAGIKTSYIPFKTTADSSMAMLGMQVTASWGFTTVAVQQGDKVRVLAIAAEERHPLFPEVPTFRELGYDYVGGAYRGIAVPKSTPEAVRLEVSAAIDAVNKDPEFRKKMENAGFSMVDVPYEKISGFMKEKSEYYLNVAKDLKLTD